MSLLSKQPCARPDRRALSEILFRYTDRHGPGSQHEEVQSVLYTPAIALPRRNHDRGPSNGARYVVFFPAKIKCLGSLSPPRHFEPARNSPAVSLLDCAAGSGVGDKRSRGPPFVLPSGR